MLRAVFRASAIALALSLAPAQVARPADSVTELRFDQFYVRPIGPRGLEMTNRLRTLAGQRVRIAGYVVNEDAPSQGSFILAPVNVARAAHADGLADDLPAAHIVVFTSRADAAPYPRSADPVEVTGLLEVGRAEEPGGRVSWVRLRLDAVPGRAAVSSMSQQ